MHNGILIKPQGENQRVFVESVAMAMKIFNEPFN